MTFEDWFYDQFDRTREAAKAAWDYQQDHIQELESDRRRLEWLALNNARVWLQDGWYDIHDNGGTCIVYMVDDWRDAIDKAMEEGE
jgi:hypothetical protein